MWRAEGPFDPSFLAPFHPPFSTPRPPHCPHPVNPLIPLSAPPLALVRQSARGSRPSTALSARGGAAAVVDTCGATALARGGTGAGIGTGTGGARGISGPGGSSGGPRAGHGDGDGDGDRDRDRDRRGGIGTGWCTETGHRDRDGEYGNGDQGDTPGLGSGLGPILGRGKNRHRDREWGGTGTVGERRGIIRPGGSTGTGIE